MKPYSFKKILNKGRFKKYYFSLDKNLQSLIKDNVNSYAYKYKDLCYKKNEEYLVNVYFVLGAYDTLVSSGIPSYKAIDILTNAMHDYLKRYVNFYSKLFKNDFIYKILKKAILKKMMGFNRVGWKISSSKKNKDDIYFEVHKCLVHDILKRENKLELGKMFCNADLILYMHLQRTEFKRSKTLIKGGDMCDMHFVRYKKGEVINRYPSI